MVLLDGELFWYWERNQVADGKFAPLYWGGHKTNTQVILNDDMRS